MIMQLRESLDTLAPLTRAQYIRPLSYRLCEPNIYVIGDKCKAKKMPKSDGFQPTAIEKSMLQHSSRY